MNRYDRGERVPRRWREPRARTRRLSWHSLPVAVAKTIAVDLRDYDTPLGARRGPRDLVLPEVERPIFVIGAPRSGTSFLGGCLGAIPSVSYHREPVLLKAAASRLADRDFPAHRSTQLLRANARGLLWLEGARGKRYADKVPSNAFLVAQLAEAFPDASFVHIVRDGRDVTASLLQRPWIRQVYAWTHRRDPSGRPYGPFPFFFTDPDRCDEFLGTSDHHRAIWLWRDHVVAAQRGLDKLPTSRKAEVRYEDLAARPREEAERIADAIGDLSPDDRAALSGALLEVSGGSIGRWRDALTDAQARQCLDEAGPTLDALGYLTDAPHRAGA